MLKDTLKALKDKDINMEVSTAAKHFLLDKGTNISLVQGHLEEQYKDI